ncbi:MAG TPA: hypothetical protein VE476_00120 [Propionibacteriaceae bacterium]|jgi:hypothetical protein|nr:hypothetical protein [Propionibacteriaceae bacterium]
MPPSIDVTITVTTPRFRLELSQSDPATPTAEDQDAQGAMLLGKLADAALCYLGHTDAFAQYVAITRLLSGEDTGHDGAHVRQVRQALDAARHRAPMQAFLLTEQRMAEIIGRLKPARLPLVEQRARAAMESAEARVTFPGDAPEPGGVRAVRRTEDLRPTARGESAPLDVLFKRTGDGQWEATGTDGNGVRYSWSDVAALEVVDCTDENRYTARDDGSGQRPQITDEVTGETFEVHDRDEAWETLCALHDAAMPLAIWAKRHAERVRRSGA